MLKKIDSRKVKAVQAELGLTTKEMACKLGIRPVTYRYKINQSSNWTLDDLVNLQALSGKSFDYFFM